MARRAGPKHSTRVEETYARGRMGALAALATLALVGTGAAGAFAATAIPQPDATTEPTPVAATLADMAERCGCDALIIGARGLGGLRGAWLGSVSQAPVHQCTVPVTVVKHPEPQEVIDADV